MLTVKKSKEQPAHGNFFPSQMTHSIKTVARHLSLFPPSPSSPSLSPSRPGIHGATEKPSGVALTASIRWARMAALSCPGATPEEKQWLNACAGGAPWSQLCLFHPPTSAPAPAPALACAFPSVRGVCVNGCQDSRRLDRNPLTAGLFAPHRTDRGGRPPSKDAQAGFVCFFFPLFFG